jgi:hypothetical protein
MRALIVWVLLLVSLRAAEPVEVLVQGAENLEVEEIVAALEQPVKTMIGPFSFWTGRIGGHRVAVQLTGQALINCVTSTILGIEEFSPKLIVNQGTAGAQAPFLTIHVDLQRQSARRGGAALHSHGSRWPSGCVILAMGKWWNSPRDLRGMRQRCRSPYARAIRWDAFFPE